MAQQGMAIRIFFSLMAFLLLVSSCAAQVYQAGFRTMGAWEEEPPLRVDVNIWYPTMRQARDLNFPPWTLSGAPNARIAEGRYPLLIISHGSSTDRFAHHNLAAWLAGEGFVVAAPTHSQDCMNNMDDLFTWEQLERRCREIRRTIDLVLAQKDISAMVDKHRIGLIGFGSGATVALLLGGALPSCVNWGSWCVQAGAADVYCSPWARDRMGGLCAQLPLTESLADTRIKAIAAIAPGFAMLFDEVSFRYFYPPLLLVSAGRDHFNRARLHTEPLARLLGKKARFLDLPLADAGALMAPCPPALNAELPEMCQSVTPAQREEIQRRLSGALLAFFGHYLVVTGNIPFVPDPPDLRPKPETEPALVQPKRRGKR